MDTHEEGANMLSSFEHFHSMLIGTTPINVTHPSLLSPPYVKFLSPISSTPVCLLIQATKRLSPQNALFSSEVDGQSQVDGVGLPMWRGARTEWSRTQS